MPILRAVSDVDDLSRADSVIGTETDPAADKIACMLKYLQSLEQDAAKIHGDNDDWRYGRYLFYGMVSEALRRAERQSASSL